MLHKLIVLGVSLFLLKNIQSFLTDRTAQVSIGNGIGLPLAEDVRVPQGAVLSLWLFNAFLADIPIDPNTILVQFADDTALAAV